jgi:hypothetical protein
MPADRNASMSSERRSPLACLVVRMVPHRCVKGGGENALNLGLLFPVAPDKACAVIRSRANM